MAPRLNRIRPEDVVKLSWMLMAAMLAAASSSAQSIPNGTDPSSQTGTSTRAEATANIPASETASPDLVSQLAAKLGSTPKQAEGAAGSLFSLAKSRLKDEEWSQVSSAVPGMNGLLKAAPTPTVGTSGVLGALPTTNALSGLEGVMGAFTKLGLQPNMVNVAIPVLTNYVMKNGGQSVAQTLASAFR